MELGWWYWEVVESLKEEEGGSWKGIPCVNYSSPLKGLWDYSSPLKGLSAPVLRCDHLFSYHHQTSYHEVPTEQSNVSTMSLNLQRCEQNKPLLLVKPLSGILLSSRKLMTALDLRFCRICQAQLFKPQWVHTAVAMLTCPLTCVACGYLELERLQVFLSPK